MNKKIGISHIVYLVIIFVILLSFILVIAFGGSDIAGAQMNVAATVTSIILAVIAIVLTLIDVAGQRQSVIDLKETAESLTETADSLKESNEAANNLIKDAIEKIEELDTMKTLMTQIFEMNTAFKDETIEKLQEIKNGQNLDVTPLIDDLNKKNEELKRSMINLQGNITVKNNNYRNKNSDPSIREVVNLLEKNYEPGERIRSWDLKNLLLDHFPNTTTAHHVKDLVILNVLERHVRKDGTIYYTLKDGTNLAG
ncbi:hypothetical protein ACSQ7W_14265 [Bacillus halotolerans]|uniref:Uncharacterized protein n=1 Tax=Bacillus halotolerans TaxID=260554 RepID=A0ABY7I586_9BACI|nr:hypothetical protein [Bacillus halotolerans]MDG0765401.1 hypothetical protein [Bacillus halotolerans]WAT23153.1 hypothetical protein O0R52_09420 [Bacillus halotolerans]